VGSLLVNRIAHGHLVLNKSEEERQANFLSAMVIKGREKGQKSMRINFKGQT